jgi:hypothetical protein
MAPSMSIVTETLPMELRDMITVHNKEKLERRLPQTLGLPVQGSVIQVRSIGGMMLMYLKRNVTKKKSTPPAKRKSTVSPIATPTVPTTPITLETDKQTTHSSEGSMTLQHMPSLLHFPAETNTNQSTPHNTAKDDEEDSTLVDSIEGMLEEQLENGESDSDASDSDTTKKPKKKPKTKSKPKVRPENNVK